MKWRIKNGLNKLVVYYFYYIKKDETKESLGKVISTSRLKAANLFANRKQLTLRDFLKLFSIEKKNPFLL